MIVLFYIIGILFGILSLFCIGNEQHIEQYLAAICALIAYLNAGIREKK